MTDAIKDFAKSGNRGFSQIEVTVVLLIVFVISAMGIPMVMSTVRELRTVGDARDINVAIILAKMRAAADFARARLYVDLSTNTFHLEVYPSGASAWTSEGGTQYLSKNATFGFGSITTPPTGVANLTQAPACLKDDMVATNTYSNTACIMFNSRGIPIDNSLAATPNGAVYLTDGRTVTGVTVSATGLTKVWRTGAATAHWTQR